MSNYTSKEQLFTYCQSRFRPTSTSKPQTSHSTFLLFAAWGTGDSHGTGSGDGIVVVRGSGSDRRTGSLLGTIALTRRGLFCNLSLSRGRIADGLGGGLRRSSRLEAGDGLLVR
jgi:hypothetical protein